MRTRLVPIAAALALAACGGGPRLPRQPTGETLLAVRGLVKGGPYLLGRKDLEALPRARLRGIDPHTGREAEYEGVSLSKVVTDRLDLKKGADVLVVRTSDHEAVPVTLWVVRQFRPVLAYSMDGAPLPKLVLAWPNVEQSGLWTDPRAIDWWAQDVVALELADWEKTYGRALRLPPGAPDDARLGAEQYGYRCISCHRVRGVGGERGPELTLAAAKLSPDAFARAVQAHRLWPQARPEAAPAPEVVARVDAFLRIVAAVAPTEEPPEPEGKEEKERAEGERTGGRTPAGHLVSP